MPPASELQTIPAPIVAPDHGTSKYALAGLVIVGLIVAVGLLTYLWSRPEESKAAAFSCGENLSWNVTTGNSMSETYGGQIESRTCVYAQVELNKNGSKVFSVANFTDCRDFKSWEDLYNGIDEPIYAIHQTFPAGHPIVAAVAVPDVVMPPAEQEEFGDSAYKPGFQISTKSGLTPSEFITASKCILDHRFELQDVFGELHNSSGPLSWLALVDETASYAPGDLPGGGQVYSCSNGYTYRTSGESLFALASGEPAEKIDESGFPLLNDKQVAVIGFDGKLYEPNRTNINLYISLPSADHRLVDGRALPASPTECVNDRGTTFAEYLSALKNNTAYDPPPENYTPRPAATEKNVSDVNPGGIAATVSQNADCEARYAAVVTAAATEYSKSGGSVSQALFYSPSLSKCIGVVEFVQGNVKNYETFDAATGETLNVTNNATAFQDWSLSPSE